MIKFLEKLLNLIYIQSCYFCKSTKEDTLLCSKCRSRIHFMPNAVFKRIRNTDIYACSLYDGVIKELIKSLKYKNRKKLAAVMAELMFEYWQKTNKVSFTATISETANSLNINDFLVLPVPIHKSRLKERKYNHMDLVCDEFCKLTKYRKNKDFLLRIKDTKKQYKLHKQERIKNIKNAFDVNKNNMPDKEDRILLIDDITSTGTTLEEIIKLLHKNGYKDITALTLATPDIWN